MSRWISLDRCGGIFDGCGRELRRNGELSRSGRGAKDRLDLAVEPVPASPDRLDILRRTRSFLQRFPQLGCGDMQHAVELAEDPVAPKPAAQRFFGNDIAWSFDQHQQQLEGQLFDLHPLCIAQQKTFPGPNFKMAEPIAVALGLGRFGRNNAFRIPIRGDWLKKPSKSEAAVYLIK
jgi:hypothetical protein